MALALDELGAAAPGPDRFADAPDGRAVRCGHPEEALPLGDDPSGIAAKRVHVEEAHVLARAVQRILDERDPRLSDGDEDRLTGVEPILDEGHGAGEKLVVSGVEERFVTEAGPFVQTLART